MKRWHYSGSEYGLIRYVDAETHQEAMDLIDPERKGFRIYPRSPGWGVPIDSASNRNSSKAIPEVR
jgi:hypothetical protein